MTWRERQVQAFVALADGQSPALSTRHVRPSPESSACRLRPAAPGASRLHGLRDVLLDDPAVEQVDAAIGVAGVPRVVRDHGRLSPRRDAVPGAAASPLRRSSSRGCRWARRRAGSRAARQRRVRPRRAAAGRPRAGWAGACARCAMPTRSSAASTRCAPLGRLHPAVGQRQLDVLEHGQVADQVEALKDEPDLPVARRARAPPLTGWPPAVPFSV